MFKKIDYLQYLDFNSDTRLYEARYRIVDDDFIAKIVFGVDGYITPSPMIKGENAIGNTGAIIKCYSERNLPITPNLFRFMMWGQKSISHWTYKEQVMWYQTYLPSFTEQINKEINMYLTFD